MFKHYRRMGGIALVLGALAVSNSTIGTVQAEEAAQKNTVRPEIGKPLQAALDLLKQKKSKDALAKLRETDAVKDKTPYETLVIGQVQGQAAAASGEAIVAAHAFEAAAASPAAPDKEKLQFLAAAAGQYYVAKEYAKSADLSARYFKNGGSDKAQRTLYVQALYLGNNFSQAAKELQADIQADEQAGKAPTEISLQLLANAYLKQQNTAGYASAMERLVAHYPKKDYWQAVIYGMASRAGFPDRLALDLDRLKLATGTMRGANDYVEATQLSLQSGFPAEAKQFIDAGYSAGLLGTGSDAERHKRLKDLVAKNLAADNKTLGQDDAQVAADKTGTPLFNTGFNYVLHGQAEKGLAMMEKGLAKGGLKHLEDARLQLAYAYHLAGQPQKAIQTFRRIPGSDSAAALARLWVIRLGQAG
ncbi:MAG: hypothetical protein HY066_01420 [Betaproteobacteria bacterium]|nr:hypothetical protein [Betaproteobacteria bacterium]